MSSKEDFGIPAEDAYIDGFSCLPPGELEEFIVENEGSPVFFAYATLLCAECGATHPRDYDDPTQDRVIDFHWRPQCTQPYGAGWIPA